MLNMTIKTAEQRHRMVRDTMQAIRDPRNRRLTPEVRQLAISSLGQLWDEITGRGPVDGIMAGAVRAALPVDLIPLLESCSGIPAAYLVHCMGEELRRELPKANLEDDLQCTCLLGKAIKAFFDRKQEADQVEEGFGFDRSASWVTLRDCDDMSQHAKALMLEIAKLAGRMVKAFDYHALPRPTDSPEEVDGVHQGGDLERILPEEAASLGVPGIGAEVAERISEDRAWQYDMHGEAPQSRGPLVIALDESGSMHDHRMVWSKACAVALTRIAHAEGRRVIAVHYADATDVHEVTTDPKSMTKLAKQHQSGGTCIATAMRVSVDRCLQFEGEGEEGADIVFVTDGLDNYGDHHFKRMRDAGIKLWTVAIDVDLRKPGRYAWGDGASRHLLTYASQYVHVDDQLLNDPSGVELAARLRDAALDTHRQAIDTAGEERHAN